VLVPGGVNTNGYLASAELYNPATGTWAPTGSMITARVNFNLTVLPNGEVLALHDISVELDNQRQERGPLPAVRPVASEAERRIVEEWRSAGDWRDHQHALRAVQSFDWKLERHW